MCLGKLYFEQLILLRCIKGRQSGNITTGESRCVSWNVYCTTSMSGLFSWRKMLLFQHFSYTQRENRQIGGKTWSLISSLFHLNETLASALHHPYETLALYEAYFALREKKFPL